MQDIPRRSDDFENFSNMTEKNTKYLKENCVLDDDTQLSFKYFFEFIIVFKIFLFVSDFGRWS